MPGLPKKYAKMGFKKGWAAFKRSKKKRQTSTKRKPKGGRKTTRRSFSTSTIFKWLRLAALVAPAASAAMTPGTSQGKLYLGIRYYTGYNIGTRTFNAADLWTGYGPYIITTLITNGIQKLTGIIRGF